MISLSVKPLGSLRVRTNFKACKYTKDSLKEGWEEIICPSWLGLIVDRLGICFHGAKL